MERELPTHVTPDLTAQQIFDYTTHFLYKQGEQSMGTLGTGVTCLYRGGEGKMCIVGCMLPDKFYRKRMEGMDVTDLLRMYGGRKGQQKFWDMVGQHELLLNELQRIHDNLSDWMSKSTVRQILLKEYKFVARNHKLKFNRKDYKTK